MSGRPPNENCLTLWGENSAPELLAAPASANAATAIATSITTIAARIRGRGDSGGVRAIHQAAIVATAAATTITLSWIVTSAPSWSVNAANTAWPMNSTSRSANATHRFRYW